MPFYEYECQSCKFYTEVMQKITDAPLTKCPSCGKKKLVKLVSAPVFRLKGSGWYETDFKGDQDNKKNLADRPEAEAAKDDKKPAADAKDAGGKEAVGKDAAGKDAGGKDAAKPAEKAADKPAEKAAPTESAKKPAGGGMSRRGAPARPSSKKAVKKPAKKPATKARRRG